MDSILVPILFAGPPPQVRGKRWRNVDKTRITGITPAGAGKTGFSQPRRGGTKDHPRRCGENLLKMSPKAVITGSPPQVRGKLFDAFRGTFGAGITPAGAGKTCKVN